MVGQSVALELVEICVAPPSGAAGSAVTGMDHTLIPPRPPRSDANRMRAPSGVNAGVRSSEPPPAPGVSPGVPSALNRRSVDFSDPSSPSADSIVHSTREPSGETEIASGTVSAPAPAKRVASG